MIMKQKSFIAAAACGMLMLASCQKEARIDLKMSDKYEDKSIELVNYADSSIVATATIKNGEAAIILPDDVKTPVLLSVMIDGRTRGYYIAEPGKALLTDSTSVATGTPQNDRFGKLIAELDAIEDLNDTEAYVDFVSKQFTSDMEDPTAIYFGTEWIRYAGANQIDSILKVAPSALNNKKTQRYRAMAVLRDNTAPGKEYTDFNAEQPDGKTLSLSNFVEPGKYTLVDFWASWCPYCIKEIPELKELYAKYKEAGLNIVGVAVRDKAEDTQTSIDKNGITWNVIFNAQRIPYEIYGFTGIPHLMLIGPDGIIISRGESPQKIDKRLHEILANNQPN